MRLELAIDFAQVASGSSQIACNALNWRAISARRWYVDIDCLDGASRQLDIHLLPDGQLLIAHRPLGQACTFVRAVH